MDGDDDQRGLAGSRARRPDAERDRRAVMDGKFIGRRQIAEIDMPKRLAERVEPRRRCRRAEYDHPRERENDHGREAADDDQKHAHAPIPGWRRSL